MQFNGHATNQDLVSEVNDLCDSDSTSYPTAAKRRRMNTALETLIGKVISADGTWEYDDTNYTTSPRGTATLVEGQEQYSFSSEYLEVTEIDVLTTTAGVWRRVKSLSRDDLKGLTTEEYFGVTSGNPNTGLPEYYDIEGDSIRLFPAPTSTYVTLAGGLRVSFKRTADLFVDGDTTQEPGLPSPYHILLAYYAAIPYCAIYKQDRVAWLEKKWDEGIKDLIKFFSHRDHDRRKIMTTAPINYF